MSRSAAETFHEARELRRPVRRVRQAHSPACKRRRAATTGVAIGYLERSLQVARASLDEQRTLEGEKEKLADGGAEIASFFSKLAALVAQEPSSKWTVALIEILTPAERMHLKR